ncbi:hypothetical protein P171DRAFT_73111 [Karstenula rhodostoma CBS 690.94]|uniref:Uncharacterized protein n=1 Tax=Karstenula rhodostoma CBS 690.94 TaxID=1392251 RepID=A0A9P4U9R4_9PLEO|nr:hypothetical protein P171DRAFT_73111 [Karstenula rhodostoma CBS 690.94]
MPGVWAKMALGLLCGAELRLGCCSYSQDSRRQPSVLASAALSPKSRTKSPAQAQAQKMFSELGSWIQLAGNTTPTESPSGRATGALSLSSPYMGVRQPSVGCVMDCSAPICSPRGD